MSNVIARNKNFIFKSVNAAALVALVAGFSSWATVVAANEAAVQQQIQEAERASSRGPYAADGTFSGSAQGYGGQVTSQVEIENGYIKSVAIVDASNETPAYFSQAQRLTSDIEAAQSTNVDVVSGATFSSAGIINGVNEALAASNAAGGES